MRDQIKAILEEICPDVDFEKEKALFGDGLIESFDVIQILTELMDTFSVELDADDIEPENMNSLDAIVALVQSKQ